MTRHEFTSSEALCRRLNELLQDPVMQAALGIALENIAPEEPAPAKGDLIQQAAIAGMKTRGANQLIATLQRLTIPPKPNETPKGSGYDEEAIELMVRQNGYSREEAIKAMDQFYNQPTQ